MAGGPLVIDVKSVVAEAREVAPGMHLANLVSAERMTINAATLADFEDPHVHATHDEAIFFLEGRGRFRLGAESVEVMAGQLVYVPAGTPHTPIVGDHAVVLTFFSPGYDLSRPDRLAVEDET